jgi:uncharacterized protein YyaL (SSP411 family)
MLGGVNRLADQASLYLRQHAENPVEWYPWGSEAFTAARDRDVPVLLSIGYSSCHWCHVMAHESFEDPAIAALMNERFVSVKVDREERPDVDALYMQATVALTGQGGWPMTVFLTPAGEPFYAGTYFPPTARSGMPAFPDLLRAIADAYSARRDEVAYQAAEISRRLGDLGRAPAGVGELRPELLQTAMVGLARLFDPGQGGFSGAPKFPPSLVLDHLLRRAWAHDDHNAREMARLTLRRMADGGIYDQIGGGFHRYSVDGVWLVPHFEKMLYDNALLARDYALAHRVDGDPDWRRVAEETLDYLAREMRRPDGAFAAAQDADSPGGEGAFFVWTPGDLVGALSREEAEAVILRYGVTEEGNFEGGSTILHATAPIDAVSQRLGRDVRPLLASARRTLYEVRSRRPAPARDDKAIAAWNGLAIAAFADAGRILGREDLVGIARETADVVLREMVVDGRLMRTLQDGRAIHLGQLDDHAALADGLLALYEATFEPRWLTAARDLAEAMVELFADPEGGGFFFTGSDGEELIARTRDLEDQPTPAGNSQAAWVLLRLAALTGDASLRERALGALALVAEAVGRAPHGFGTALIALEFALGDAVEIAIVGAPDDPATRALIDAARRHAGPHAVIAAGEGEAAVEAAPLLAGRSRVDGRPAAYVCRDFACRAPVADPVALAAELGAAPDAAEEGQPGG